jgi:hypothetical protein
MKPHISRIWLLLDVHAVTQLEDFAHARALA